MPPGCSLSLMNLESNCRLQTCRISSACAPDAWRTSANPRMTRQNEAVRAQGRMPTANGWVGGFGGQGCLTGAHVKASSGQCWCTCRSRVQLQQHFELSTKAILGQGVVRHTPSIPGSGIAIVGEHLTVTECQQESRPGCVLLATAIHAEQLG